MSPTFFAGDDVIATTFAEGGAVLIHLGQNKYFLLNNSAGVLWASLSGGAAAESGVAALRSKFDVDEARAGQSCRAFVKRALSLGILVEKAQPPAS